MAKFDDMSETDYLQDTDEVLVRQSSTDKRINFELATLLNWATLNGYDYVSKHVVGSTFGTRNSFTTSGGIAYFPKHDTELPYTSTSSNPAVDENLTTQSYKDYKLQADNNHFVGSSLLIYNDTNPNDLYTWQNWQLITGDASIRLGDGTTQSQTPEGDNDPEVPLRNHTHTMNHDHPSTSTSSNGSHNHLQGHRSSSNIPALYGETTTEDSTRAISRSEGNYNEQAYTSTSGGHTHTLDVPEYTGSTGTTGDSTTPTLDVRGSYIKLNLWIRVS